MRTVFIYYSTAYSQVGKGSLWSMEGDKNLSIKKLSKNKE